MLRLSRTQDPRQVFAKCWTQFGDEHEEPRGLIGIHVGEKSELAWPGRQQIRGMGLEIARKSDGIKHGLEHLHH